MKNIITKKCTQCKTEQPISEYGVLQKKYYSSICKTCCSKRSKQWYENNKSKVKERRERNKKDPKYILGNRERVRRWISNNLEKYREAHRVREHRRRVLLKDGGNFTVLEWTDLCDKYDWKCLCCGERKDLTVDHIIPVIKGGANTIDNIQSLCLPCNMKKHDKIKDYRK